MINPEHPRIRHRRRVFGRHFLRYPTARRRFTRRPRCPGCPTRIGRPWASTTPGRRRVSTPRQSCL
jgi:hypothetical protein